ncbi:hypothetical protein [Effusibacillus consociatus]|uniref:Uncharacterized protein n=1 Tax=Effusibacillus consociatus TaxID=1117041 RepID=A0ABV9Q7T3_9BACL
MKWLTSLFFVLAIISGTLLHIWTVFIAYSDAGFLGAILTFVLPGLAQIYWFYDSAVQFGIFGTVFNIACASQLALTVFNYILGSLIKD